MSSTRTALALALVLAGPATAADLLVPDLSPPPSPYPAAPRYFPRGDGGDRDVLPHVRPSRRLGCVPRRVPIPTNAEDDPSYVGSTYGLSKPSYYGFTPPLGVDDPFGRPLLPYCR